MIDRSEKSRCELFTQSEGKNEMIHKFSSRIDYNRLNLNAIIIENGVIFDVYFPIIRPLEVISIIFLLLNSLKNLSTFQ